MNGLTSLKLPQRITFVRFTSNHLPITWPSDCKNADVVTTHPQENRFNRSVYVCLHQDAQIHKRKAIEEI